MTAPLLDVGNARSKRGVPELFATSTAEAVRQGARNAVAFERAFRALQSSAYEPRLVLTGGDASRILNALSETPLHRPHLVLQYLATMLDNPR